jgi:hypothetical protein
VRERWLARAVEVRTVKTKTKPKTIEYGPANETHGYTNVRWVENVSRGLRLVGFADKIAGLNHNGWYTVDDGDNGEVYRGVVYQLPARDGREQFIGGYADPCNDDCALVYFDVVGNAKEAACLADRFAETFAEAERDYQRAWAAGRRYDDLDDDIKVLRKKALAIGAEMRAARVAKVSAPTICPTLRSSVMSLYRRIQEARKERAKLLDNFGRCEGFTDQ